MYVYNTNRGMALVAGRGSLMGGEEGESGKQAECGEGIQGPTMKVYIYIYIY
jgi:hypothetical protein